MSDGRWAELNDPEAGAWNHRDSNAIALEARRARSEEARLLDEVKAKDECIKALMTQIRQCASGDCGHSGDGEECLQDLAEVSP